MTELSFAKSYLSLLDSRPIKLQADHVSSPQTLELNGPYTLPRQPNSTPMQKPGTTTSTTTDKDAATNTTGSSDPPTLTIHLKSSRNPTLSLTLPSTSPDTSILDLKERIATDVNQPSSKIRILYQKKPCSDAKTIKDVVGQETLDAQANNKTDEEGIEFSVMVMGYTASNTGAQISGQDAQVANEGVEMAEEAAGRKEGEAREVLHDEKFWSDLRGWVAERLGDEGVAEMVVGQWRGRTRAGDGKGT